MKTKKRILAILFAVLLTVSILPSGSYAEDPPGTGTLSIRSSPAGADVYINGVQQTVVTPAELDLAPGTYQLKLSIPGYEDYLTQVEVSAGNTTTVGNVLQLPKLVETEPGNIITVNSGDDSAPNSILTVEQVKAQPTITLRDAVTAIMNDTSGVHFRIEFAEDVSTVSLYSMYNTININKRGNLTINGDRDRNGTADVKINHSGATNFSLLNVITSDTYIIGLKFDGSANGSKASFLSLRVPDESTEVYNISNLYILGCEFINTFEVGVATCGAYGYGAEGYDLAGTTNFSNLVFAGNSFNRSGLFSFAGAGDEDYNVIDGYTIAANQFKNCGIGMLAGDAHTWYVYGENSEQGYGNVPGQIGYCENNVLRNVLISGNSILLNSYADEEYTSIINISAANLGNSGNLLEKVTIRNNTSIVSDPGGKNIYANLAIGNVCIGDGGNAPNYGAPNFVHHTSDNTVQDVTMQYNDFELGNGRGLMIYNVTTDVNDQEGDGNIFQNIHIDSNRFVSANGALIANYMDRSECGSCSDNNTNGVYFTNNTVTTSTEGGGDKTGILAVSARVTNQFGSPVTNTPEYTGTMKSIVIDGNTVTGNYQYGITAAGSAGDYVDALGIENISVSDNTINLTNSEARFGIVAAGGVLGTYGDPPDGPFQPGSTNCFLKDVTISENNITAEGGIAVCGDLYESAPRAGSIAGNHVDTITINDNSIAKPDSGDPSKDLPGILIAGIADIWNRLSELHGNPIPIPTLGGNTVTGATIGTNTITGFEESKQILDCSEVKYVYPVNSAVTGETILNELKALTNAAYGDNSYDWTWSGTAYDSSTIGSYMAKGSRQGGQGIETLYYEIVVDSDVYDNTGGNVTVTTQNQFLAALNDDAVSSIIAESFNVDIQQGTELTKDLTIADTATLLVRDNGLLIVQSGKTLTLNGNAIVRDNGELRIGGTLVNNVDLTVGAAMTAAPLAEIQNKGTITVSQDSEIGEGRITLFNKISDTETEPFYSIEPVTYGGDGELVGTDGTVEFVADVKGQKSLDYAMGSTDFNRVMISIFHDTQDPEAGVDLVYTGNLAITKPLDVLENDTLTVSGDLTVAAPKGELNVDGDVEITGGLTNNNYMYIGGTLTIGGAADNNGYYIQAAEATVNGTIMDTVDGDHMMGYYVTNQDGWNAAISDSAHCNPIVIAPEASIVVNTNTTITSNLVVQGGLTVNEEVVFNIDMRYDGDINGVYNEISGTLTNNGTINLNVPVSVCGTLDNNGIINTASYKVDDNGGNWTEDGSIILYTWSDEEEILPDKNGSLKNSGTIVSGNLIAINDSATVLNESSGLIDGGYIKNLWDLSPGNTYPLVNEGLLRFVDVGVEYSRLVYYRLDHENGSWFEVPEWGVSSEFYEQADAELSLLFGLWDYDEEEGSWGFVPVLPEDLQLSSEVDMQLDPIPLDEVSTDPDRDTTNKAAYTYLRFNNWGDYEISYTAADSKVYRMAATVEIPDMGYYSAPVASRDNYISSFNYTPELEESFYAIVQGDFTEGWTGNPIILEGENEVTVTKIAVNIYEVTVNKETAGDFGLNLKIILNHAETDTLWEPDWWINLHEAETEGLVLAWPDWREGQNGDYRFNYPILPENSTEYKTKDDIAIGGTSVAFFFRHQAEDDSWVYDPLEVNQLNVVENDSGISMSQWQDADAGVINDPEHTGPEVANYLFTQLDAEKLGNYTLRYTVVNGETSTNYDLPITVKLPDVAFYRATSATIENYIDSFSYSQENRTFYMIANPDFVPGDGVTSEYEIYDGADKFDVAPVENTPGVYSISVKDGVYGDARFHGKIRLLEGGNEIWSSDRDIIVNEAEAEGLVLAWPQRNTYDDQNGVRFDYPVLTGEINYETRAYVSLGNQTPALFHKYNNGEVWVYDPVEASEVIVTCSNPDISILYQEWAQANVDQGITIEDENYSKYKFTQISCFMLDEYTISYTVGEGEAAKTFTLPLTVTLPKVGFYSGSSTNAQDMEVNYIEEFEYTPQKNTFYAIIQAPGGYSINSVNYDDDNVIVAKIDESPVYSITVKENAYTDFNMNFRAEFINDSDSNDKPSSDMWISVHEGDYECLVYRNLDWDGEAGGHFENMDWGLEKQLYVDPREHVGIFYKKESDGIGGWTFEPVDVTDDNMTISPLDEQRVYSGNDVNKNTANALYYRSITFNGLGTYILEYTEGDKTFSLPVNVDLPNLGAYMSTDKSMNTWLSEVDFTKYREVFIIPHEVDMANADLAKSEFIIDNVALVYDELKAIYTGTTGQGAPVSIAPYKEDDLIKHFTVTVLSSPFEPDFRLFAKINDGNSNEITYNEFNFFGRINKADSIVDGGSIAITEGAPGTVTFSDLGNNAVKYFAFTAADLAGGKAYTFSLEGYTTGGGVKSDGAMLYLFDENWKLIDESRWENLMEEGRQASIGNSELVKDETYYIAVYNGHSTEAACGFELIGAIVDIPPAPVVISAADEGIGVSGIKVSGAVAGQKYEIYTLVGEEWQHRGSRDFDINTGDGEYTFFNAFDLVMDGETVTQFAAAISKNGVEGPRTTLTSPIPITREDTNSSQPLNVQILHYSESSDLMVTASNGVFQSGVYYRLRHEKPDGFWDFHGSFIGNGTNTVFCGGDGELADPGADGRYIVAAYSEGLDNGVFRLGWTYAVKVEKGGETPSVIGSFAYERPTTWLAIGEGDFDQNNQGSHLLNHNMTDGRTKFRLVTYDKNNVGNEYTFGPPLNASDLTASAGLTLTDMTGDEVEYVKFSFVEMGDYTVSYTDGSGTYKVILSANSPAPSDAFDYTFDKVNGKADITINIQSLRGREGEVVQAFFALYEGGRLIGISANNPVLGLNGFSDDKVTINFDPAANPDNCKAFVLSGESFAPLINTITIVPAPILTKIETSMDGGEIWLTFDKEMADPTGKHNQFTVYVNNVERTVTSASIKAGDNKTIVLSLESSLQGGEDIKIAYEPGDVAAADGGLLGAIIPEDMMTMQEGEPAFTAGVGVDDKAHVGTELTIGPGTLSAQTNLTYVWFRSDDQSFDPQSDVQLGTTGTKYTPVAADKGKYIIVHVSTPDAAGDKYAVIQVE